MRLKFKRNLGVVLASSAILVVEAAPLPFLETFESADGVTNGSILGQNGWTKSGGPADVQSNVVQSGQQALEIQNAHVIHDLSSTNSAIWLHFQARCEAAPASNPSVTDLDTSLAFFVNTGLNLVVYSNTVPVELGAQMQLNTWTRFDIYCDYDDQYWDLSMDGVNVAAGLPLYSTNTQLGSLALVNDSSSPVYIDQIDVADTEQTASGLPDSDSDAIPDWWEQKYFGGVTSVIAGNPSGNDGLSYLQTYIAGVSPFAFDPFDVSLVPAGNGLRWTPIQSRRYSIYSTTNLVEGFSLLQGDMLYPQNEFIDTENGGDPSRFYRLKVQVQ